MRVLKFSSAAVIVLLLFFASLPPSVEVKKPKHVRRSKLVGVEEHAVGVEEQNDGRRSKLETSQPRCRVPEITEGVWYTIEKWPCKFPTAEWMRKATDDAASSSCTTEEAADEIMKEASKQLTAITGSPTKPKEVSTKTLKELNEEFRILVKRSLVYVRDYLNGPRDFYWLKYHFKSGFRLVNRTTLACISLGDFRHWILEILMYPDDEEQFCKNYPRILAHRMPPFAALALAKG